MGYYMRGDYYRGDYYRGDPFLGALLGRAASALGVGKMAAKAGKWILGRITPGAVKTAATVAATGVAAGVIPTVAARMIPSAPSGNMPINMGPVGIDPMSALPGGSPLFSYGKRKYRRMNPLNPRALKRALRRAEGFEKFAKQTVNALYRTVDGRRTKTFKRTSRKGK